MAAGDRQGELLVVVDFIGAKQDRRVFVLLGAAAKGEFGPKRLCTLNRTRTAIEAPDEPISDSRGNRSTGRAISHLPDGAASRRRKSGSRRSASRPPG